MDLKQRWEKLWQDSELDPLLMEVTWEQLVYSYNEVPYPIEASKRSYHNLDHISHGFKELDDYIVSVNYDGLDDVRWAWFFHDCEYSTIGCCKSENEHHSGIICFDRLVSAGMESERAAKIFDLIQVTKHDLKSGWNNENTYCSALISDIDLSSLGLLWPEFLKRQESIRPEFAQHTDEYFYQGSVKVFSKFLDRDRIFLLDYFHQKYEEQARNNISNWFQKLKDEGRI